MLSFKNHSNLTGTVQAILQAGAKIFRGDNKTELRLKSKDTKTYTFLRHSDYFKRKLELKFSHVRTVYLCVYLLKKIMFSFNLGDELFMNESFVMNCNN